MKKLKSKKEIFSYIEQKYYKHDVKGIVVVGSTAKGKINNFSDVDVVVFNNKILKPECEIILFGNKLVLITVYFYKPGLKQRLPKKGVILFGDYFKQIEHKNNLIYNSKERNIRDNQMFVDSLFKFLRSKNKKYLDTVDKYSRFR